MGFTKLVPRSKVWLALGLAAVCAGVGCCFWHSRTESIIAATGLGFLGIGSVIVWQAIKSWTTIESLFLLFVVTLPLTQASLWNTEFGLQPSMALVVVLAALIALRALVRGEPIRFPRSVVNYLFILFWALTLLSILYSWRIPVSSYRGERPFVRSIKQVVALAWAMLGYFTALTVLRRRNMLLCSIRFYVLAGFVVSLFGLYQFVGSYLGLPFVDPFGFNASFGTTPRFQVGGYTRIWSTASEPDWFGDYLVTVIPLVVAVATYKKRLFFQSLLINLVMLSTILLAFMLTFTRSAYLALGAAFVPIIYFSWKKLRRWVWIFVGLCVALLLLDLVALQLVGSQIPNIWSTAFDRLTTIVTTKQFGNEHRYTALLTSLRMLRDDPILGRGYGNYGFFFEQFRPPIGRAASDLRVRFPVMTGGILFRIWVELGLVGLLVFISIVSALVFYGVQAVKRTRAGTLQRAVTVGLLSSTIGSLARMLFANSFHFLYTWFVWASLVVAAWQVQRGRALVESAARTIDKVT